MLLPIFLAIITTSIIVQPVNLQNADGPMQLVPAFLEFLTAVTTITRTTTTNPCTFTALIDFFGTNELNDILQCISDQELTLLSAKIVDLVQEVDADLPDVCKNSETLFQDTEVMQICSALITNDSLLTIMKDEKFLQIAIELLQGCIFQFLNKAKLISDFIGSKC